MACFIVPAAEAVVTSLATKVIEKKERKEITCSDMTGCDSSENLTCLTESDDSASPKTGKFSFSRKLKWLNTMLWGGSGLLAFEHLWHGELVPWYPFLTAARSQSSALQMVHEMSTVGVAMAGGVTLAWILMVVCSRQIEKSSEKEAPAVECKEEV